MATNQAVLRRRWGSRSANGRRGDEGLAGRSSGLMR
jgi:hypothetical protein